MNTLFTIATLGVFAAAQSQQAIDNANAKADLELLNYATKYGKSYKSVEEMQQRSKNYQAGKVKNIQSRLDNPKAKFGDTPLSDLSEEEFMAMLGRRGESNDRARQLTAEPAQTEGRSLQGLADIDWVAAGNMHPVKDQGYCGSCAAFAATTVLEGMASIQNGNAAVVRLSEQQGLDCSRSYGNASCNGGLMELYFEFYSDNGAMAESDYMYAERDQACRQTSSSAIEQTGNWATFVWLPFQASIASIHEQLSNGPLSIGINASGWSNYQGGIMSAGDLACGNTYRSLNHGVTAVAFSAGSVTTEMVTIVTPESTDRTCYKASRNEKRAKSCNVGELIRKNCCETTTTPASSREEMVTTYTDAYWRIQNQWGVGWGDMGFMDFEVVEGNGVCGFNMEVQSIEVIV